MYVGNKKISISIVSHLQAELVNLLLSDINNYCDHQSLEVLLTLNLPEELPFSEKDFSFPVRLQVNQQPQGFGANHNQAFRVSQCDLFSIVNPDIRLDGDPFPSLLACLDDASLGVVAPKVVDSAGDSEDSARRFPTPLKILSKALGRDSIPDYRFESTIGYPDWVGGMFMLFPSEVFRKFGGFDERYFLYYEDVEFCGRLNLSDFRVAVCPLSTVVHHAQRSSHRNLKYFRWHLTSMLRFFMSPVYRKLKQLQRL